MKSIAMPLALFSAVSLATTVITGPEGTTYINKSAAGYSATNATSGETTNYITTGGGLITVVPEPGLGRPTTTYIITPDTSSDEPLLLDSNGVE